MASVDVPPGRRGRRALPALGMSVVLCAFAALAVLPLPAAPTGPATRPIAVLTDPEEQGGETPTAEPTATDPGPTTAPPTIDPPQETGPPPTTDPPLPTTTAPQTVAPTTAAPTSGAPTKPSRPSVQPSAPQSAPAAHPLGVRIETGDVTLTAGYWNARSTVTTLQVTVTNTGSATARVGLSYRLPTGLTDAGTAGCAPAAGGGYRCGDWTAPAGARFSSLIRVRVAGDAWRRMPLGGSVAVTAAAPGVAGRVGDDEGFAVLFPPGPPAAGIALDTDEVTFDISGTAADLAVRLTNTGSVDAAGRIDVLLPAGVSVPAPPAGCVPLEETRTRCDLGTVRAGHRVELRLPVAATPAAQRDAPLAGAVIARLAPSGGGTRQVQMSFRISAAVALATPVAAPAPTGSQGVLGVGAGLPDAPTGSPERRLAIVLVVVSTLLVALALGLVVTSLRRRLPGAASAGRE
ncbi:hypothetical protein [Micromonospora musae]|uniref:DUF11 domain-containing protein n=1 Tax=Micromonospora musae TaxID=1894970 RepID=A0A3A9YCH9_9ACTN|nr:hypothetical protein [Micromonospora musae]RKN31844.1 hypothetical protein D7044_16370 [Micromonospora musae]